MNQEDFLQNHYNVIGKHTFLKGNFIFKGDLFVMGKIEGTIQLEEGTKLILDSHASIIGQIYGGQIKILGSFEGSIETNESVEAMTNSTIFGKVICKNLECEPGSLINAEIRSSSEEQAEASH